MIPEKKQFIYRRQKYILLWMLLLGIPFALMIPDFLDWIPGILYYVINSLSTLIVVFIIWRMTDFLPGVQKTGYYWKENGRTVLSYDGQTEILDSVTELFLSDRHVFPGGSICSSATEGKRLNFFRNHWRPIRPFTPQLSIVSFPKSLMRIYN